MVHSRVVQNIHQRAGGAGLGIPGAKHQAGDTAVHHRARAHDAGLEGHVQRGVDQAVVLQHQSALA